MTNTKKLTLEVSFFSGFVFFYDIVVDEGNFCF